MLIFAFNIYNLPPFICFNKQQCIPKYNYEDPWMLTEERLGDNTSLKHFV